MASAAEDQIIMTLKVLAADAQLSSIFTSKKNMTF
jgi:hypothetical protein